MCSRHFAGVINRKPTSHIHQKNIPLDFSNVAICHTEKSSCLKKGIFLHSKFEFLLLREGGLVSYPNELVEND
jgi:hypothetical protein